MRNFKPQLKFCGAITLLSSMFLLVGCPEDSPAIVDTEIIQNLQIWHHQGSYYNAEGEIETYEDIAFDSQLLTIPEVGSEYAHIHATDGDRYIFIIGGQRFIPNFSWGGFLSATASHYSLLIDNVRYPDVFLSLQSDPYIQIRLERSDGEVLETTVDYQKS